MKRVGPRARIECVVVDLDGTILDRPASLPGEANSAALSSLLSKDECLHDLSELMRKVSTAVTVGKGILASKTCQFETLLDHLGRNDRGLADRLFNQYMQVYLSRCQLYPEVKSVLEALDARGVRVGLITNSPDDIVTELLRHFHVDRHFDFIVAASLIRHPKPSQAFTRALGELAGVPPNVLVLAGDGDEDEATAAAMGAIFYRVVRGRNQPSSAAPFQVADLAQLFDTCFPNGV